MICVTHLSCGTLAFPQASNTIPSTTYSHLSSYSHPWAPVHSVHFLPSASDPASQCVPASSPVPAIPRQPIPAAHSPARSDPCGSLPVLLSIRDIGPLFSGALEQLMRMKMALTTRLERVLSVQIPCLSVGEPSLVRSNFHTWRLEHPRSYSCP
jgi:hypothetical protein